MREITLYGLIDDEPYAVTCDGQFCHIERPGSSTAIAQNAIDFWNIDDGMYVIIYGGNFDVLFIPHEGEAITLCSGAGQILAVNGCVEYLPPEAY
jgi:hypothetical protein